MKKRMVSFLCVLVVVMGALLLRVAYIANGGISVEASAQQSMKTVHLAKSRAGIFDRNMALLVNRDLVRKVAVFPDILEISKISGYAANEEIFRALQKTEPSVIDTGGKIVEGKGIFNFSFAERYGKNVLAPHIVGYMNGGKGVFGIERSFDTFLLENGKEVNVTYYTDGTGKLLVGEDITLSESETFEQSGVVLTIDSEIQKITEKALSESFEKGAAVVLDVQNGQILASASVPDFEPGNIAEYLKAEGSPFVNRAFSAYTVGSTWKLVVAAAALDLGISESRRYTCTGSIEVDGRIYKCHWSAGHGEIDMARALEISCNPYFIDLALEIGGERILETAKNLGFGSAFSFGENFSSAAGKLPEEKELSAKTVLASFAFGQGSLMATPLHMAVLASAAANGGKAVTPTLVLKTFDKYGNVEEIPDYAENPVMSEETAEKLKKMMVGVVEKGSGENAKPEKTLAGGKTASAQTGQFDSDGNEIIHAWFVGFYPAKDPEYAIAVFAEGMNSGGEFAAPVFKKICDGIDKLKY